MRRLTFFCLSTVSLFSLNSYADDFSVPAENAPGVVISATRTPTPANQVGSSVTVITSEQIEQRQPQSVVDILRDVPGVTVAQNGGIGQTAEIYMRGAPVGHTLVLIDGLQVNDPSNIDTAYDFAYLTPENIERIEVLRGPQSTLYGSQAIGGVINIITKHGQSATPQGYLDTFLGSYNTRKTGAGTSGSLERFSYNIDASHLETDGISSVAKRFGGVESDPYRNNTLSGDMRAQLTDNASVGISSHALSATSQFDNFDTSGGGNAKDYTRTHQYTTHAFGDLSLLDGVWKQEFALSNMQLKREYATGFGYSALSGDRNQFDWTHHVQLPDGHLATLGLTESLDSAGSLRSRKNQAAFLQDQFSIAKNLFITVGGRVDYYSDFNSARTWRLAPAYVIDATGTTLKASYGTGFRVPSLFQLFDPFSGTPTLRPERSRGVDAGFEQRIMGDKVTFGSTYFYNNISNLIDFDDSTFKYFNVSNARTQGVENTLTWRPDLYWTARLNYTYMRTEDESTHTSLLRRPKNTFGANADYRFDGGKGDAGVYFNYVGSRLDSGFGFPAPHVENDGYQTLGLSASYQVTDYAKFYSRLDNILNKRYMAVYGYGNPGFTAFGGVRLTY